MTEPTASLIFERIGACGVIPVVNPPSPSLAAELGAALLEGGLLCVEITFRAEGAPQAIERLRRDVPSVLVGAGTVLTVAQAHAAIAAGAQFLVSPGTTPAVIDVALQEGIPIIPGVATPSEIEANLNRGIAVLKLFPAEVLGGVQFLKAVFGPYGGVRFVPTGGINPHNLADYVSRPNVLACGGTWIATPAALSAGDLASVSRLAREAVEIIRTARALSSVR
jgi:2-dehydro-3-deoxyphosphogluconate aldolase / (4S)-4-hydroxy-2-oxoglutarate aldolase